MIIAANKSIYKKKIISLARANASTKALIINQHINGPDPFLMPRKNNVEKSLNIGTDLHMKFFMGIHDSDEKKNTDTHMRKNNGVICWYVQMGGTKYSRIVNRRALFFVADGNTLHL